MAKHAVTPEVLGYHVGAVQMALTEGTTDQLDNVVATQGQVHSLLRGWSAAALGYVTVALTSDGKMMVSSTGGGSGAGSTDVSIIGTVAVSGPLTDAQLRASPVPVSGGGSTAIDATLSSAGSTRVVGRVDVNNPTTGVTVVPGTPGSSADYLWVRDVSTGGSGAGSTTVDANLSSAGSTRVVGRVDVNNPTTAVSVANPTTSVTVTNPATAVTVSSGLVLGAGSSANILGSVALVAGSSVNMLGAVANSSGVVNGASSAVIGLVAQGSGSSGNQWFVASVGYSSGGVARSSISTTVDIQLIAANANRKALVIANRSTAQTVGVGFSTAVLTTALANVDIFIPPSDFISFGIQGGLPLYLGPLRGLNLTSTTVAGSVGITEFT